jgi:D-alanyl-D-alanine carboxypeptidase
VRAIDAIVSSTKNGAGVPGMVVGIWDPKRGTLIKGYGTGDLERPQSTISTDDHVRIASVTKTFTATAILQLVATDRLDLDAHLAEFVPDIPNGDTITVAQLLDMTAGVYSYTEDDGFVASYFADPQLPFTAQDALAIVRAHPPDFAPGTDIHYSDSNYVLLQLIAEQVTGSPLGETIRSQILDEVGLDATTYPTTDAMPEPFSHGYLAQPFGGPRDVTLGNPGVAGGAGAMISSLEDLHHWAVALGTGTLLPKSLQKERLRTRPLVTTPKVKISYGMGISNLNGFVGHDGGILGYATAMFYLPKQRATIVVESNSDNVSAQSALWTFVGIASYLYPEQFPKGL